MGSTENKNIKSNKNNNINILLIGDRFSGKTSFLNKYTKNEFNPDYKGTPFTNYSSKIYYQNNIKYLLQIWEISGNDKKGKNLKIFADNSDGAIILCDANDIKTRLK